MTLILTTVFLAVAALALSDFPLASEIDSGSLFNDLTFTVYPEKGCQSKAAGIYTGQYGFYEPYQMQSYHLSRTLHANETLDFYAGLGTDTQVNNTIDHTMDGNYSEACWIYDATAGLNATTQDKADKLSKHLGKEKGCHTLDKNEWCALIWLN
ncbi:MAG: hypothetical protein Q9161_008061 [Pseudevernia consocians]